MLYWPTNEETSLRLALAGTVGESSNASRIREAIGLVDNDTRASTVIESMLKNGHRGVKVVGGLVKQETHPSETTAL